MKKSHQLLAIFVGLVALSIIPTVFLQRNFNVIGKCNDVGHANDIFVVGDYAYVAAGSNGLEIIDISDPVHPLEVGNLTGGGNALGIQIQGNYAYVADESHGLEIIDISNPTAPFEVGQLIEDRYAYGVHIVGGYAYMVDGRSGGLFIIDISDPTTPIDVGHVSDGGIAKGVMVQGDYAYVADVNDGLEIIDISDPTSPVEVGQIDNGIGVVCVFVSGSYAYVGDGCGWMRIIDISVPSNPVELAVLIDNDSSILDIYVSGAHAYVADYYDGLKIIDISDPAAPTEVKHINNGGDAKEVDMSGSYVYVVGYFGLEIIEPWGQKETISNVIFWSFLGVLILLALVDLRYLFTEMKPLWTESSQKWREAIDPYKAGEKYKAFDFFLGFFMMIGEVIGLFPLFFAYYYGWIPLFGLIIMLIGLCITDFLFVNLILTKGRRYIAIGMLIVAPLFIFGLSIGFLWY